METMERKQQRNKTLAREKDQKLEHQTTARAGERYLIH
jgi:hypothetical protein